jgi:hypothetical protein
MADFGYEFDSESIAPQEAFDILPVGEYECMVTASDIKTTKAGDGQYLWLELTITEGDYKGRKVFDRINFNNPNPKAQEIGQRQLSGICHATGQLKVSDSSMLHDIPVIAVVKIRPGSGQYSDQNEVKAYKACGELAGAGASASNPPTGRPAAQSQAKPPVNNGGGKPPWAAKR